MIKETLGEKLKSAREARKLSVRDVTRETNIVQKFIEALENNEFSKFPGETYLLGFLRNYGNFLRLDEDELIQLYKGQQISESQTPLEELTKPTTRFNMDALFESKNIIVALKIIAIPLVLFILFKAGSAIWDKLNDAQLSTVNIKPKKEKIPAFGQTKNLRFIRNKAEILLLVNEGAVFQVNGMEFAFKLLELSNDRVTLMTYPGESRVFLPLNKQIESQIPECTRQLLFEFKAATQNTAKIEVELGKYLNEKDEKKEKIGESTKVETTQPETLLLKMNLYLNDNSYIEAYLDGRKKFAGLMTTGQEANWTASKSIQLHLGNADGVKIKVNNKEFTFKGKVMNKIFSWKRDPLDPAKFEIHVNDN